jgi:hypothetical protein
MARLNWVFLKRGNRCRVRKLRAKLFSPELKVVLTLRRQQRNLAFLV